MNTVSKSVTWFIKNLVTELIHSERAVQFHRNVSAMIEYINIKEWI